MFPKTFVKDTFKDILVIDELKTKFANGQTSFNGTLKVVPGNNKEVNIFIFSFTESLARYYLNDARNIYLRNNNQMFNRTYNNKILPSYNQKP